MSELLGSHAVGPALFIRLAGKWASKAERTPIIVFSAKKEAFSITHKKSTTKRFYSSISSTVFSYLESFFQILGVMNSKT